ncbi:MAG: AIR carboxylase family protein, partial [Armatimonadetes bacterium]|nr:AIR carboxylase family protein [Armatimonadota bacterium]
VYIAVAGKSNGLGPVIEGNTLNPVINCPPINAKFSGMDILSSLSLPRGIACGTIIEPENAALFALKILAQDDLILWGKLKTYRYYFQEKISQDDEELNCGSSELSKN